MWAIGLQEEPNGRVNYSKMEVGERKVYNQFTDAALQSDEYEDDEDLEEIDFNQNDPDELIYSSSQNGKLSIH